MKRREFSNRIKAQIVERAMNSDGLVVCEGCQQILRGKKYEIDHVIPEALITDKTKPLTAEDGQLLGVTCCHRGGRNKTADDVRDIAKVKRIRLRHLGIRKATGFRWQSKFKRKMDGSVVLR